MDLQNDLKTALMNFLEKGEKSIIKNIINNNPEIFISKHGEYPDFHRIVDISLGGKSYRVCREISSGEKLTFSLIDKPSDIPGVPIWLEGEKLKLWAKLEEENHSDVQTDWDIYK